jgi:hypothetical protein
MKLLLYPYTSGFFVIWQKFKSHPCLGTSNLKNIPPPSRKTFRPDKCTNFLGQFICWKSLSITIDLVSCCAFNLYKSSGQDAHPTRFNYFRIIQFRCVIAYCYILLFSTVHQAALTPVSVVKASFLVQYGVS